MPEEILTGFAAYCTSMPTAFSDFFRLEFAIADELDRLAADGNGTDHAEGVHKRAFEDMTPEISCGIELFGRERFFKNPTMRSRTWRLKGSGRGTSNRLAVFQEIWLDQETLTMIHSFRKALRDIKAQVDTIAIARNILKEQDEIIIEALCDSDATATEYTEYIQSLIDVTQKAEEAISDRIEKNRNRYTEYHKNSLASFHEQLEELHRRYAALLNKLDMLAVVRDALALTDTESFASLEGELSKWSSDLSGARNTIQKWFNLVENRAEWRDQSLRNCIEGMLHRNRSLIWKTLQHEGSQKFSQTFCSHVVPRIEDGFRIEGYSEFRISSFRRKIQQAANELTTGTSDSAIRCFKEFLKVLVSALIYGPESDNSSVGTIWDDDFEPLGESIDSFVGDHIVISQLLAKDGSLLEKCEAYGPNDIIFFGRCNVIGAFVKKCHDVLPSRLFEKINDGTKNFRIFAIGEAHGQVSNLHGMLMCTDRTWRYRDFSRFGTRIVGIGKNGDEIDINLRINQGTGKVSVCEVSAGNVLYLGAGEEDEDSRLYFKAAVLKLSFSLDTNTIAYLL